MQQTTLNTNTKIENRLKEFSVLGKKSNDEWFCELCFCLLTANSKALTAINIQKEIGTQGFLKKTQTEIANIIKNHGHRFHNTKAKYIIGARKFAPIKDHLENLKTKQAREFLVHNIKGLGYKESSHFLRNVGYHDVAIIDRHILRFLHQEKLITDIPKTITQKKYMEYENILKTFHIPLDKLDLIIWEKMTGEVLK
jgi:N-glycosylase/DNA lyase